MRGRLRGSNTEAAPWVLLCHLLRNRVLAGVWISIIGEGIDKGWNSCFRALARCLFFSHFRVYEGIYVAGGF